MESKTNICYGFFRHCMQDEMANMGKAPSREDHWLKRLNWSKECDEAQAFYTAFEIVRKLNEGRKIAVREEGDYLRIEMK